MKTYCKRCILSCLEFFIIVDFFLMIMYVFNGGLSYYYIKLFNSYLEAHGIYKLLLILVVLFVAVEFLKNKWGMRARPLAFEKHSYYLISVMLLYNAFVLPYILFKYCSFQILFPEDLAYFAQGLHNTLHGHPLMATIFGYPPQNWNIALVDHFVPFLIFLTPFYYLYQDAGTLLVVQTVFVSLGAVPIYFIAVSKLKNKWIALLTAIIYVLCPLFIKAFEYGFRLDYFAMVLLLFAFWGLETGRRWLLLLSLFLAILCKENVFICVFFLSIHTFFKKDFKGHKSYGISIGIFSLIFGILIWALLFSNSGKNDPAGNSTFAIHRLDYIISGFNFAGLWDSICVGISNLSVLLRDLGYVSIFSSLFVLAIGTFLENVVGCFLKGPAQITQWHWHNILFVPFIYVAYIYGISNLLVWGRKFFDRYKFLLNVFWAWVIGIPLLIGILDFNDRVVIPFNENNLGLSFKPAIFDPFFEVAKRIPKDGCLFSNYPMCPNLSNRDEIFLLAIAYNKDIDYFLTAPLIQSHNDKDFCDGLKSSGFYELYCNKDQVELYVKNELLKKDTGPIFDFRAKETLSDWSYALVDTVFKSFKGRGGLCLDLYFDGNQYQDEYVKFKKLIPEGVNLNIYPFFEISYGLEDSSVQLIEMLFGLDSNGDNTVDIYKSMLYKKHPSGKHFETYRINLYETFKEIYPDKNDFNVLEIGFYPHKRWHHNASDSKRKWYRFWIRSMRFFNLTFRNTGTSSS